MPQNGSSDLTGAIATLAIMITGFYIMVGGRRRRRRNDDERSGPGFFAQIIGGLLIIGVLFEVLSQVLARGTANVGVNAGMISLVLVGGFIYMLVRR